mgnify:CR=1 FL=1
MHQLIDAGNWLIDDSVERVIERHEAGWRAELEKWDARNVIETPKKDLFFDELLRDALRMRQNQRIPGFPFPGSHTT